MNVPPRPVRPSPMVGETRDDRRDRTPAFIWRLLRRGRADGVHELHRPRLGLLGTNRDIEFERAATRLAGFAADVNVDGLIAFAEERAGLGPVHRLRTRNFIREAREELADFRNYIIWALRQLDLVSDETRSEITLGMALAHVAIAYDLITNGDHA